MVLDSSAVVAILLEEPEVSRMADALAGATDRAISTANLLEAAMVLFSRKGTTISAIEAELAAWGVEIVPVSLTQARLAAEAFRRFGRGRHPARLNYGDCFAYALARDRNEPLLLKGDDFAKTDVMPAA
jgi:ribonuclease VapC